jgi:hypothetical protein
LGELLTALFAGQPTTVQQVQRLLESGLPLGGLCDVFGFALPLDLEAKQQLLEEVCVGKRVRALLRQVEACASKTAPSAGQGSCTPTRRYPPGFSEN